MMANLCFSLSLARDFLTNFNGSVRQNFQCYVKKQIEKKNFMVCTLIDHRNDRCERLKTQEYRPWKIVVDLFAVDLIA